jgi:hypothetical protein
MVRQLFTLVATSLLTPVLLLAQGSIEGPLPQLNRGSAATENTSAPPPVQSKLLDNTTIIRMTNYQTAPDDLVMLKSSGVSQPVIAAMLARNSGLQQRPAPATVEVTPISINTDDPGVYYKNREGQWEQMSAELVHYRDGGALKSLATHGIIQKDMNGVVNGPKSTLSVPLGTEMLILTPTSATEGIEYVILRFRPKSDRREFRVKTGNVFHSETGSDRDALDLPVHRVSSRLYGFTVPRDLQKGQYGVLAPGSAGAPGISHAGKIYTFSISE